MRAEEALQRSVTTYLEWCLPETFRWTASLTGVNLNRQARGRAKAAGVRRGWPDLAFLFPDGVTRYIELKAVHGSLSLDQRAFRDAATPHDIWALCRSVEDVAERLLKWGAPLRGWPGRA